MSSESVASVLPEAVSLATSHRERDLSVSLEPTVTQAVANVTRRQPELYGEILAPTIGTAVRKAVSDAFSATLKRFDAALEQSFSVEGLRWRIEAARTGRPFAEIVLLRTLEYRVEQVFLIHTRTSLVLEHVVDPHLDRPTPDQVAALLTAIDTFAREALGPMVEGAHLEHFKVGDLVVYVSRDASITLAAVLWGTPATEVEERIAETRLRIAANLQRQIARFDGDVTPFADTRPELESLLTMERRRPRRRAKTLLMLAGVGLSVMLLAGVAWRMSVARARAAYVAALAETPGIVVTRVHWSNGRGRLVGLRDPLADKPEDVVARPDVPRLSAPAFAFAPFISLDPALVRRRAERVLDLPSTASVAFDDGTLRAFGVAPRAWIEEARSRAETLPGVDAYDERELRSQESLDELRSAALALEEASFVFDLGQHHLLDQQRMLDRAARHAAAALVAARDAKLPACIEVIGGADATGTAEQNAEISARRALSVADGLVARGLDPARVRSLGAGTLSADPSARRVNLRLDVGERLDQGCEEAAHGGSQ